MCQGEQSPFAQDFFAAMVTQVSPVSTSSDVKVTSAIASTKPLKPESAIMPPQPASPLASSLLCCPSNASSAASYNYLAHITGAVRFDSNGLPQEYFITSQISLENWEQLIFQLLGLRWLLMSSLQLDRFGFARVSSGHHTAVLIRQRETYLALLLENLQDKIYDLEFRQWLSQFELAALRSDERFQSF